MTAKLDRYLGAATYFSDTLLTGCSAGLFIEGIVCCGHWPSEVALLQVFAIEFVPFAIEFVAVAIEFVPFAIEFVAVAIEFVPLAIEFVAFAIEFVAFAFVRNKNGSWSKHENMM